MCQKGLLRYALNPQNKLVSIEDVAKGLACECHCPACNEKLIAKNCGAKRIHHFSHASGTDCKGAYETMLHQLAKIKVQEAFLNKDIFNVKFEYRSYCPNTKSCGFVRYDDCYISEIKTFNLKLFYDSCEQEVQYNSINRRSDLKIYSSKNNDIPPIYIEFCVTHASDDFKLHNGGKIIEIHIESEDDIDKIVAEGFTESTNSNQENNYDTANKVQGTIFYGFKSDDYNATSISREVEFSRYVLYASGKSRCYQDVARCTAISKTYKQSLLEICFHTSVAFGIYEMAKYQGYKKFGIKNCLYCKNYVDSYNDTGKLCRLYKYLGINKQEKHDTARAKVCSHFILNEEEMVAEIQHFNSLHPNEYTIFNE